MLEMFKGSSRGLRLEEMPMEVEVKMPETETPRPLVPPRSETRDLMLQAAQAHDAMARRNAELENGINRAIAHLEAAKNEVDQYKLLLAQERNNNAVYRTERDEAKEETARLEAGLANCHAILEQLQLPPPPVKRHRNGKSVSDVAAAEQPVESGRAVPDEAGGKEEVGL